MNDTKIEDIGENMVGCFSHLISIILWIAVIYWFCIEDYILTLIGTLVLTGLFYLNDRLEKKVNSKIVEAQKVQKEKEILRLAAVRLGYLTAVDITIETDMDLDESEEMLNWMKSRGLCSLRISDNGTFVYQFESLLSYEEKKQAEKV
ncbi:hypothetical protein ABEX25_23870 [Paenibacillus thiaminolyticus]|uniref:hypothetical protein n=1 Tax=Paenibacillus thiaminolyticus TaxID=49283 RepID=UPI003D2D4AB5